MRNNEAMYSCMTVQCQSYIFHLVVYGVAECNACQLLLIWVRMTCYTKCRAIITAHNCLLFEPATPQSKKFLEIVTPRLTASEGARALAEYRRGNDDYEEDDSEAPPFELEMIEGALMVATGLLPLTPFLSRYG